MEACARLGRGADDLTGLERKLSLMPLRRWGEQFATLSTSCTVLFVNLAVLDYSEGLPSFCWISCKSRQHKTNRKEETERGWDGATKRQ